MFSCPRVVERDPSYPPPADSPSLPTPSWIGRMASRQEGGGRNLFSALGWSTRSPFSRRGLAFVFLSVVCCTCCALITYVCCWLVLCVCLFCVPSVFVSVGKTLVFDPGVRGTDVGPPVHSWSCVLLVLRLALSVFLFSWRCGVLLLFLSSLLALPGCVFCLCWWVCVGGPLFFCVTA